MPYLFPLSIQLTLPENENEPEFLQVLRALQENRFYGVELNITNFEDMPPEKLMQTLSAFDLRLTMLASGGYAKKHKLSLSSTQESVRKESVDALCMMAQYAAACNAGVICGFLKGDAHGIVQDAQACFCKSLEELAARGTFSTANIYLEATNRREALLVNTVAQGVAFAEKIAHPLYILPDTYHMNLEEADLFATIEQYQGYYQNLHLSDDNRAFPGFGSIAFEKVLRQLKNQKYQGTIAIEGNITNSMVSDIHATAAYLASCATHARADKGEV